VSKVVEETIASRVEEGSAVVVGSMVDSVVDSAVDSVVDSVADSVVESAVDSVVGSLETEEVVVVVGWAVVVGSVEVFSDVVEDVDEVVDVVSGA
jgi:3-deoxy-D-arabino-heptulosonate 7-phosphate (DAHP) synthase